MHFIQRRTRRPIAGCRRRGRVLGPAAVLAAVAALAVLPGAVTAQPAPPPPSGARFVATELPDSAVGRQMAWFLEASGRLPIAAEEIRAHFAPSFLALPGISPAQLNAGLRAVIDPAGARLVGVSIAEPDGLVAVVSGAGGRELVVTLVVGDGGLIEYATLQLALTGVQAALPAPSGPAAVGTDVIELADSARGDRRLVISRWYPAAGAARGRPAAAYVSPPLATAIALPTVRVHARLAARPRRGRLPVVLFSPGYGTPRVIYQAFAEDLASHGYLVIAVDHTGEAPMEFPGGGFALTSPPSGSLQRVIAAAATTRLADLRFLLRRLGALPTGPQADPRRVAAIGHSLGGATAAALMQVEPAVRAGVDMDGSMIGTGRRGVARPFLIMAGWRGLDPTLRSFLRNSRGPLLALRFRGLEHMSFSDLPAIAPDAIAGARRRPSPHDIAVQRTYLRAFLDRYVRGRRSPLLDGPSDRRPRVRFAYRERCCG